MNEVQELTCAQVLPPAQTQDLEVRVNTILWDNHLKKAEVAFRLKNFSEAVCMGELAMQKCITFEVDDWRTMLTQRALARYFTQAKDYDKAQDVLSKLLATINSMYGEKSCEYLELERILSSVLEHKKSYHIAAKLMLHVVNNHPQRLDNPQDADFLAARKRYDFLRRKSHADHWEHDAC